MSVLFDTVRYGVVPKITGGVLMGDKSPKSKDKNKKQTEMSKDKKSAAAAAVTESKRKDGSK